MVQILPRCPLVTPQLPPGLKHPLPTQRGASQLQTSPLEGQSPMARPRLGLQGVSQLPQLLSHPSPCPAASVPRDGTSSKVIKLDSVRQIAEKVRAWGIFPTSPGAGWARARQGEPSGSPLPPALPPAG